jgi:hypothetical protein
MVKRMSVVSLPRRSFSCFGRHEAMNGYQIVQSTLVLAEIDGRSGSDSVGIRL